MKEKEFNLSRSQEDVKLDETSVQLNLSQDSGEKPNFFQNSSAGGTGNTTATLTRKQKRANYVPLADKLKNSIGF